MSTLLEFAPTFSTTYSEKAGVRASALEDEALPHIQQAAKAATPTGGFGLRKTHVFRYGRPVFVDRAIATRLE
jgi:hypothetical protein